MLNKKSKYLATTLLICVVRCTSASDNTAMGHTTSDANDTSTQSLSPQSSDKFASETLSIHHTTSPQDDQPQHAVSDELDREKDSSSPRSRSLDEEEKEQFCDTITDESDDSSSDSDQSSEELEREKTQLTKGRRRHIETPLPNKLLPFATAHQECECIPKKQEATIFFRMAASGDTTTTFNKSRWIKLLELPITDCDEINFNLKLDSLDGGFTHNPSYSCVIQLPSQAPQQQRQLQAFARLRSVFVHNTPKRQMNSLSYFNRRNCPHEQLHQLTNFVEHRIPSDESYKWWSLVVERKTFQLRSALVSPSSLQPECCTFYEMHPWYPTGILGELVVHVNHTLTRRLQSGGSTSYIAQQTSRIILPHALAMPSFGQPPICSSSSSTSSSSSAPMPTVVHPDLMSVTSNYAQYPLLPTYMQGLSRQYKPLEALVDAEQKPVAFSAQSPTPAFAPSTQDLTSTIQQISDQLSHLAPHMLPPAFKPARRKWTPSTIPTPMDSTSSRLRPKKDLRRESMKFSRSFPTSIPTLPHTSSAAFSTTLDFLSFGIPFLSSPSIVPPSSPESFFMGSGRAGPGHRSVSPHPTDSSASARPLSPWFEDLFSKLTETKPHTSSPFELAALPASAASPPLESFFTSGKHAGHGHRASSRPFSSLFEDRLFPPTRTPSPTFHILTPPHSPQPRAAPPLESMFTSTPLPPSLFDDSDQSISQTQSFSLQQQIDQFLASVEIPDSGSKQLRPDSPPTVVITNLTHGDQLLTAESHPPTPAAVTMATTPQRDHQSADLEQTSTVQPTAHSRTHEASNLTAITAPPTAKATAPIRQYSRPTIVSLPESSVALQQHAASPSTASLPQYVATPPSHHSTIITPSFSIQPNPFYATILQVGAHLVALPSQPHSAVTTGTALPPPPSPPPHVTTPPSPYPTSASFHATQAIPTLAATPQHQTLPPPPPPSPPSPAAAAAALHPTQSSILATPLAVQPHASPSITPPPSHVVTHHIVQLADATPSQLHSVATTGTTPTAPHVPITPPIQNFNPIFAAVQPYTASSTTSVPLFAIPQQYPSVTQAQRSIEARTQTDKFFGKQQQLQPGAFRYSPSDKKRHNP